MSYISAFTKENAVYVWERIDPETRLLKDYPAPFYFYADDPTGEYKTIYGTSVSKVEASSGAELYGLKKKFSPESQWESDIPPETRILSKHYYGVTPPKLNITLLDIEVDYDPELGVSVTDMVAINPYAPINSVALVHIWKKEIVVYCVPPEGQKWTSASLTKAIDKLSAKAPYHSDLSVKINVCASERILLQNLLKEIESSDVLSGWNSDKFDMPYIARRIALVLDGEDITLATREDIDPNTGKVKLVYTNNPNPLINKRGKFNNLKRLDFEKFSSVTFKPIASKTTNRLMGNAISMSGRLVIDYMDLVKKYEPGEKPSYKLAAVSAEVNVDEHGNPTLPKLEYAGSLADLYVNNFPYFVRYNIRDTEVLYGFEKILGYIEIANVNFHLSTGQMAHVTGTLKLAELALVNLGHHVLNVVVNNVRTPKIDKSIDGALVLLPRVGLHENSGAVDIKSLYPNVIISLNISPEMLRGQFRNGVADFVEISNGSAKLCTLVFEKATREIGELTLSASAWREELKLLNWAVSGYGTVFDQSKTGFIPRLLLDWYALRKKYQALNKQFLDSDPEQAQYYDRLQYVYKIKLNSLYGAMTNLYFRFYDLRLGESTTGSGRVILKHQCRTIAQAMGESYDIDFPLYHTIADAIEAGYTAEEAKDVALSGPKFNGQYMSQVVIYGDTDSVDGTTIVDIDGVKQPIEAAFEHLSESNTVLSSPDETTQLLLLDGAYETPCIADEGWDYSGINLIYRHKSPKRRFKVTTETGETIIVTEDHSLVRVVDNQLQDCKPTDIAVGDIVICQT